VITEGDFGYKKVNVHDQMRDVNSLLNWIERVISARKECLEFGWGEYEVVKTTNPCVLAHACHWKNGYALALHNLSNEECMVEIELNVKEEPHLIEHFADHEYGPLDWKNGKFKLQPFGYRWFRKSTIFL
jgi:maltose alpha-D-glucosyltransferase / alpha-amylase